MKQKYEKNVTREDGTEIKIVIVADYIGNDYIVTSYAKTENDEWFANLDKPEHFATPDEINTAKFEFRLNRVADAMSKAATTSNITV